ncbi:MAG: hypothetical protein K2L51_02010 [Clostridiales bacterium]|nr:hypothetical protein [Clostridiales bacterium]
MKTRRIIPVLLCICFAFALFCGCDAQIDVYEQQSDEEWNFRIDVRLHKALASDLEQTAALSDTGKKWTVDSWLNAYFSAVAEGFGLACEFDGTYDESSQKSYRFYVDVPKTDTPDSLRDGLQLQGDTSVKTNLFVRTINVVRDDRFNYWVRAFGDALDRYDKNTPTPMDAQTAMGIVLFGYGSYVADGEGGLAYEEELPGLFTAFPAAQNYKDEYTEIVLKNFWYASRKMQVAADDIVYVRDGNGREDRRGAYYVFERTVGNGDTSVEYVYFRADPTGWYIVAVAVGLAVAGIAVLIYRMRKKRQNKQPPARVEDSFPYDPFADYFGGSGVNGNDNDPFAGY